jgi:hypothetical protein
MDCSHISQSYQPLLEDYPFGHLHRLIRFIPLALGFGQPHGFAAVEELIDLFRLMAKLSGDFDDVVVFLHSEFALSMIPFAKANAVCLSSPVAPDGGAR